MDIRIRSLEHEWPEAKGTNTYIPFRVFTIASSVEKAESLLSHSIAHVVNTLTCIFNLVRVLAFERH